MRKLRLLFASMFALLAWNGAFAQTEDEYNAAQAAIVNGETYLISTQYAGAKYYLTADGYLTEDQDGAGLFKFQAVTGGGNVASAWWVGESCFSNPPVGGNPTLNTGKIAQYGSAARVDWEAQIFYLKDGLYAVRCSNVADTGEGWNINGQCFWTVNEGEAGVVAEYSLEPNYVWALEKSVDERPDLFNKIQSFIPKAQEMTGLVQNASQWSSNAKESSEGSYEALTDGDYTTFFHSSWSAAGPDEDHYLQAELPNGAKSFYIYFKKRSQNNNNRPTTIVISASNDGVDFEDIDEISEGLPTDASVLDYASDLIDLGAKYKYVRFSIPATNNGATHAESTHPFFTFSEFYILPNDEDGLNEKVTELVKKVKTYTDVDDEAIAAIEDVEKAIAAKYVNVTYKVIYNDEIIATAVKEELIGKAPSLPEVLNNAFLSYTLDKDIVTKETDLIYATASWNGPFEFTTPEAIEALQNKWYNMTIRGSYWVGADESEPYYPKADKDLQDNANQWAFVGDLNHVTIYNRAYGNTATLAVDGDNVVMREGEPYVWDLFAQADGFVIREAGTDTRYVNQNGGASGPLQFWNSANGRTDNGSTFRVTEVVDEPLAGGEYYLFNVGSGLYLGAGNSWGTQASLLVHPEAMELIANEDGTYKLKSQVNNGGESFYFGNDAFLDQNPAAPLTLVKYGPQYLIEFKDAFIGYNGESSVLGQGLTDVNDANAQWVLLTKEDLMARFDSATPENPVDATFMFLDPDFGRNNVNKNTAWIADASNRNLGGGDVVNFCAESWRSAFNIYQTAEIPDGRYFVLAQATLTDYAELYDGADYPVVYANDVTVPFWSMEESDRATDMTTLSHSFSAGKYPVALPVAVVNGKLTIGVRGTRTDTWAIWDNFQVYRVGACTPEDYTNVLDKLIAEAQTLQPEEKSLSTTTALEAALDKGVNVDRENIEQIKDAIDTLTEAINKARISVRSFEILAAGDVEEGLENWSTTNGGNLALNTWSVEADESGMVTPFVQTSVGRADKLSNGKMQYTLAGVEPGTYFVTADIRIYREDGSEVAGAKAYTNSDEDDLADATPFTYETSAGIFKTVTLVAQVGEDETLVFGIESIDPTYNWIAVKNLFIGRPSMALNMNTGSFNTELVNGKLANEWNANEDEELPAFDLTSKFYTMTSTELNGGWPTVEIANPYIGFYTDGENGVYTVTAPEGVTIAQLKIEAKALRGLPTIAAEGGEAVAVTEGEYVFNYHGAQSATFIFDTEDGDYAWIQGQIVVVYNTTGDASGVPVTGVNTVKVANAEGTIFNVAGQRVNKAVKGIYIVNGKKVVK